MAAIAKSIVHPFRVACAFCRCSSPYMTNNTLRMYIFDGGRVHIQGVRFLAADGSEELRDMADPNHCYLIEHPGGLLLWDAGLSDAIHDLPGHTLERGKFRFVVERPLSAQLAEISIAPGDVRLMAFSHLQVDHAGNAALFPSAEALIQSAEYRMAFGRKAKDWGYVRADYARLSNQARKLEGDLDVFGDGRVRILAAPGHTPGHQVLFVDLPRGGPVLLSGDLYYAEKDPTAGCMPAWNYDKVLTRRTMQRLETFAAQHGARWLINHQPGEMVTGWID